MKTASSLSQKSAPRESNPYFYEAYGLVYKVNILERGLKVIVDINHLSPIDSSSTQALPVADPELYDRGNIEFSIFDQSMSRSRASAILHAF